MCLDKRGNQQFSCGSKIIFWPGNTEREKVPNAWGKVQSCKVERAQMRKCSAYFHTYLSNYVLICHITMHQILISRMFGGKNYQSFLSSFPSFIFFAFLLNIHINLCVMYFSKLGFSEKSSLFFSVFSHKKQVRQILQQ